MKSIFHPRLVITAAAAALLCARPAVAQQQPSPLYKDPGTATIIGVLVPGGGHFYSGETKKGAMILGIGLGGLVLGTAISAGSVGVDCDDDFDCEDETNYLPAAAGYLAYLGAWVYGIMDASNSAERMNAQRGLAIGDMELQPTIEMKPQGETRVGFELRF